MPTYTAEQIAAAKALVAADVARDDAIMNEPDSSGAAWEQWYRHYQTVSRDWDAADDECIRLFGWGADPVEVRRIAATHAA